MPRPASAGATTVSASLDELSPMTEIALPPMVTGAETSTSACVPEPMPSSPEVIATGSASPPPVMTSVEASDDCESPMREIALPPTVTGSSIEIPTWEPDRMPSSPLVSDAWATPAPRSVSPPAKRVAYSALSANLFMIQSS